jgi:hypothetical protein
MKVTVNEAMRIKNEMDVAFNSTACFRDTVAYGTISENGVQISGNDTTINFDDFLKKFKKILEMKQGINSALATFNVKSGISDLVRKKNDLVSLKEILDRALKQIGPEKVNNYVNVGNERKLVERTLVPFVSKGQIKNELKEIKREMMEIQSTIDELNCKKIELSFLSSYDELNFD